MTTKRDFLLGSAAAVAAAAFEARASAAGKVPVLGLIFPPANRGVPEEGVAMYGDKLHVVERFRLDPTTTTLKREYTAEDPVFLTAAYTGSDSLSPSNVPFAVEACEDLTPTAKETR